jgi:hypothetical protein
MGDEQPERPDHCEPAPDGQAELRAAPQWYAAITVDLGRTVNDESV